MKKCTTKSTFGPFYTLIRSITTILLEFPFLIIKWTNDSGREPSRNAVEMIGVIAHSPRNFTFFSFFFGGIGLAIDTRLHDVVPANSAVVNGII